MELEQVFPNFSFDDAIDLALTYHVLAGKLALGNVLAGISGTYFFNLRFGKFGKAMFFTFWFESIYLCVFFILQPSNPLQISNIVIGLITIFVIYLVCATWSREKVLGYQTMYGKSLARTFATERYCMIALMSIAALEYFSRSCTSAWTGAAHHATITDFIKSFISNYGFPLFHCNPL